MTTWGDEEELWELAAPAVFAADRTTDARRDVDAVMRLLALQRGARVLDMCAGQGRHAIELAQRGMRVTAVDRSRTYLDVARESARAAGVELELVREDMRRFVAPQTFDAALNLYTSFGYFDGEEENRRVASNMRASLVPGGGAVFELRGKEVLAAKGATLSWTEAGGVLLLEEPRVGPDWEWVEYRFVLVREGVTRRYRVRHRLYSGVELRMTLHAAGFVDVTLYGGFDGRPYDDHAELLVAVARA